MLRSRRTRALAFSTVVGLGVPLGLVAGAGGAPALGSGPHHLESVSVKQLQQMRGETEGAAYQRGRVQWEQSRYVAGTHELSPEQAEHYRYQAATAAGRMKHAGATSQSSPLAPTSPSLPTWSSVGPQPIRQVVRTTGTFQSMSGRISALAIAPDGRIYAGGAQGGLWRYDPGTQQWTPLTDDLPTLSVGAVTIAPSDPSVVYLATGEGDLSGDSYFGDGVWRSDSYGDPGTWTHVSGTKFDGVSISRLLVDPSNPDTIYIATLRGRAGSRRVTPPGTPTYGVYRSTNSGQNWTLLKGTTSPSHGATDIEFDPNNPGALFASFWDDGIYKSNNKGQNWASMTPQLTKTITPKPDFSASRFSLATAALPNGKTRIYAGFDWYNAANAARNPGAHRGSRLFRSDNGGGTWRMLPYGTPGNVDAVFNYCDIQCSYDNVVEVDPSNPDIVYAAGEYDYNNVAGQLGGIYRSEDGGMTWQTLGVDLHPDFHALAFQPNDPGHIAIGNDGGVWDSPDRGGRLLTDTDLLQCISDYEDGLRDNPCVDWRDLNVGLSITQFDSIDYTNADNPGYYWGGTQDNGTLSAIPTRGLRWYDESSGDGGQVVVDHNNPNFVFGTYYNLTGLYRYDSAQDTLNAGSLPVFTNQNIMGGIDRSDRSEFYIPLIQNQGNSNQLFTGTYRVYRTDNAETPVASNVQWQPISDDLTSGCTGPADNGGRGCFVSALGVSDGGTGGYAGTEEGWIWSADNATTSDGNANWVRNDPAGDVLPGRPVSAFAVDRSNWRIAYASFEGFDAATPGRPGHVFKTTDGGQTWTDVTGNLPDNPVNGIVLDPSDPNTLFASSDVGSFVTHDDGAHWAVLGSGLPRAEVYQQAYDPSRGLLIAGTHGRGAWTLDTGITAPAFVASTTTPGIPVGPGSDIDYTVTVQNVGDQDATGVTVTNPIPAHTTVSPAQVQDGGTSDGTDVAWTGLSIPAGSSATLHFTATIDPSLDSSVSQIVDDGLTVSSLQGAGTTGSPTVVPIAPQYAASISPAHALRTAQPGTTATYQYKLRNLGFESETFDLSVSGNSWNTVVEPDCSTPGSTSNTLAPGATQTICVAVDVPGGTAIGNTDGYTLTAHPQDATGSSGDGVADATTKAVNPVLLVDEDGNAPDVQSYYTNALNGAGLSYDVYDIAADGALPDGELSGYSQVYWFTGTSFPGPLMPYEKQLGTYLDNGGRLFVSGMDILDQAAGTTTFVHDYLHINWDGSETQNDKSTTAFHGVSGDAVTNGLGSVSKTAIASYGPFEDRISPINGANTAFTDDSNAADGLDVSTSGYKVVFIAFPLEEYGGSTDQADLIQRVSSYFGS